MQHIYKEEEKKKQPKNDPILESERTCMHGRHSPDLPCGEITIEDTSTVKHCTTHSNREKSKDKNKLKQKESNVQK